MRISTNYAVGDNSDSIDNVIESMLYENLKPYLNEQVTKEMFVQRYTVENGVYAASTENSHVDNYGIQSSQKVGPSIADDIKAATIWAVIFALIGIGLYILLRFRNWTFSVGAVVGLMHDALFILGVYSLCYMFMPFSLEIDQSFIAAILTVIGYSINDTVVVFDRVRENVGLYPKRPFGRTINDSLNSTLSRTFSTSLSTFVVLVAIFIFGGETIRGFVFAIMLGVIEGVYSTLFVATPITYELTRLKNRKKGVAIEEQA